VFPHEGAAAGRTGSPACGRRPACRLARMSLGLRPGRLESVTRGASGAMVLLGVVFWAAGAANRKRGLTGETEFCPEEAASAGHPSV
jgi:hypothetical protein